MQFYILYSNLQVVFGELVVVFWKLVVVFDNMGLNLKIICEEYK